MSVTLEIKSPYRAYEALRHVATLGQEDSLIEFIIGTGDRHYSMLLLHGHFDKDWVLTYNQIIAIGTLFDLNGAGAEKVMECFSLMPAHRKLAQIRMNLLSRLLRRSTDIWLKGRGIGGNVFPLFRQKAQFLPLELDRMIAAVERTRDHAAVDALADFRMGLFLNAKWEKLQQMAMYFHSLAEKRKAS